MTWPYPSTHPPTHQIIHTPWGGEVSIDFKSSNRIEISRLVQVLLNFDWFRGSPPWGCGVGGWGGGWWGGAPYTYTCMCMHACIHTHTCVWHHREFPWIPPMGAAICMKLSCLPRMHVSACACMHAHACAHMWGAPPNHPPPLSTHPPQSQSCREPETPKFNNSWTNQNNSILFEDSLPLNIPELI